MLDKNKINIGDKVKSVLNYKNFLDYLPSMNEVGTVYFKQDNVIKIKWENKKINKDWYWFFDSPHTKHIWYENADMLELMDNQLEFDFLQ